MKAIKDRGGNSASVATHSLYGTHTFLGHISHQLTSSTAIIGFLQNGQLEDQGFHVLSLLHRLLCGCVLGWDGEGRGWERRESYKVRVGSRTNEGEERCGDT